MRKAEGQRAKTRLAFLREALTRRTPKTKHKQLPSYAAAFHRVQESKGSTTAQRTSRGDFSARKPTPPMPHEPDGSRRSGPPAKTRSWSVGSTTGRPVMRLQLEVEY